MRKVIIIDIEPQVEEAPDSNAGPAGAVKAFNRNNANFVIDRSIHP